jgi:hypothetical protein
VRMNHREPARFARPTSRHFPGWTKRNHRRSKIKKGG